ncbi:MAG: hypothetical protein J6585_02055 [Snodgrassella sp.]|nr:hypothetical protein [Snodgrassella sp.]
MLASHLVISVFIYA